MTFTLLHTKSCGKLLMSTRFQAHRRHQDPLPRPECKLRPKHRVIDLSRASVWVSGVWLCHFDGSGMVLWHTHRIPPPGQKDEMSLWSQSFQSCHVKTNWLPQQHQKWLTGVAYLPLCVRACVIGKICHIYGPQIEGHVSFETIKAALYHLPGRA